MTASFVVGLAVAANDGPKFKFRAHWKSGPLRGEPGAVGEILHNPRVA
ncbi:MAG: hypothetical protein R3B13_38755 [Polyangiaceae bacterium]